jgi:hypothetical protein
MAQVQASQSIEAGAIEHTKSDVVDHRERKHKNCYNAAVSHLPKIWEYSVKELSKSYIYGCHYQVWKRPCTIHAQQCNLSVNKHITVYLAEQ